MKRTVLLLIVSLFIIGTLAARVTVPENVMYEVPEPEPESITDVTEEPEHTTDIVGPVEEKDAENLSPEETNDMPEDEGEIDLTSVPSDVEENSETKDEPVGAETTETSEQPEAEMTEASVETEPEITEEVSQPEDVVMEDSVDIEVSEDETSTDVVAQDVVPDEGNEPTEMADEIVTVDETSDTVTEEDETVEGSRMKLLVGMEAAHFAWNIDGGRQVAGYPLPCSGIFVAGLLDDRYILGADTRVSYPVNGTTTNANFEVLGRFGMFSPLKRFSNDESVFFAEGDLLLGTAVRSNAGDTFVDPVVGLAGRIHLGREFLTMAIGTDVMVMFPISGAGQNPSYTIRPNLSLMWNL